MTKKEMILTAIEKHHEIFPVIGKKDINECFTEEKDSIILWYNDKYHSTHIIISKKYSTYSL